MNWVEYEDENLSIAYANVSGNKRHGTDRTGSNFWNEIYEKFVEQHGATATKPAQKLQREKPSQLQCRWSQKIKPDVSLFANLLSGVWISP